MSAKTPTGCGNAVEDIVLMVGHSGRIVLCALRYVLVSCRHSINAMVFPIVGSLLIANAGLLLPPATDAYARPVGQFAIGLTHNRVARVQPAVYFDRVLTQFAAERDRPALDSAVAG